jgi:glycosyltransferase involved in cell wall biosynthesis
MNSDSIATTPASHAAERPKNVQGLVSIITVTFNSVRSIDRTIDSVVTQSYENIEYIVIDGASHDGTVDRLVARASDIDYWRSESDGGISDAFNKGIFRASGEFIMLLNSDDWIEPGHIETAVRVLQETRVDFVFGDIALHGPDGTPMGLLRGDAGYSATIVHRMPHMNHPTVVCRLSAYQKYGLFDVSLHNAMDYDWLLRVHAGGGTGEYVPNLIGHMTLEGRSDAQFNRSLAEVRDISIKHGYPTPLAWLRFAWRVGKGASRRLAARLLPQRGYRRLRAAVNRSYVP